MFEVSSSGDGSTCEIILNVYRSYRWLLVMSLDDSVLKNRYFD